MVKNFEPEAVMWPWRKVIAAEEVENQFDEETRAARIMLECGHECVTTGDLIPELYDKMKCKFCYDEKTNGPVTRH